MTKRTDPRILDRSEYMSAVRADHGNVRRFLSGCRCSLCDRPSHYRFWGDEMGKAVARLRSASATERAEASGVV